MKKFEIEADIEHKARITVRAKNDEEAKEKAKQMIRKYPNYCFDPKVKEVVILKKDEFFHKENKKIEKLTLFERYRLLAEKGYLVNIEIIGKDENSSGKVSYTGYVSDENGEMIEDVSSCDDFEEAFKQAIELVELKLTKKEITTNKKKLRK